MALEIKSLKKSLKDMSLGELVESLVVETVNYVLGQWTSDSPYKSKEEYNQELLVEYIKRRNALKGELDRREKLYSRS